MRNSFILIKLLIILFFVPSSMLSQSPESLSFEDLSNTKFELLFEPKVDSYYWEPTFTDEIKNLDGKLVKISGYLIDLDSQTLVLCAKPTDSYKIFSCFHGLNLSEMIFTEKSPELMDFCDGKKYEFEGRLNLNSTDIFDYVFSIENLCLAKQSSINAPLWQQILYSANPNAHELRAAYEAFYKENSFEKSIHTQNYKRWLSHNRPYIQQDGNVVIPTAQERALMEEKIKALQRNNQRSGSDIWSYAGPEIHFDGDGSMTPGFRHTNVYCHDRATTNTQILYCGTESCGAYKSYDGGQNWENITADMVIGDVQAIRVNPTNENYVIMSANNDLYRSVDGGETWSVIGQPGFVSQNIRAWEIAYNSIDPSIVYAACNLGFFRSTDGGDNWTEVLTEQCNTIAFKPDDPATMYTIKMDDATHSRFYKSTDSGATWTMYDAGWYDNAGNVNMDGGRLATSAADPNRIYAILVGYQNDNSTITTNGWIGAWVSYDAGETWEFPHNQIGTPYTEDHPNLMNFTGDDGDYTQINYNTTLIVSQLDADKVLIGGLNLWKSNDACATYEGVGGYIGGISYFHVDQQEYRIYQTGPDSEEIWFSNDGGFGFSDDFMESHQNLNRGIQSVNLWGYDQGWNEDMMVGGRYHNGNMAYHELYPAGEFQALGGGEAATGYVNYSDENRSLFSDIGGYILPDALNQQAQYFSNGLYPNESYWNNNSSRILFDNNYFNVAWLGKENKIYKSTNGGGSYSEVHAFGNNADNWVLWIEQSYADNNYMYCHQAVGNSSKLWRTGDAGETWDEVDLPQNNREMVFTLSATNPDEIWVAYYYGTNGNKVFHTINGGGDWENMTTSLLNGLEIWAIAHQYGTDGGVYIAMKDGLVFYRNNTLSEWQSYSTGLPMSTQPLRIVPFYKGEKIRLATWNLGVWEAPLFEPSSFIADFAAEFGTFFCPGDPIHFVDHSVAGIDATYAWSFPGATPSSSTEKNPTVVYNEDGTYDVSLTVTQDGESQTVTKTSYISGMSGNTEPLAQDFENGSFPSTWNSVGNGSWAINSDASAYGTGEYSMRFDNYYYDAQGQRDEIWLGKQANDGNLTTITFDVAYAEYGPPYTDTLAVLYSLDCGDTWTEMFMQGGDDLATAPDNSNFYVPTSDEWENHEISFTPNGTEDLIIAFQNRGHYGNAIYVDNINVETIIQVEDISQQPEFNLYPNPASDFVLFSAKNLNDNTAMLSIFDAQGKLISSEKINSAGGRLEKRLDVSMLPVGLYTVKYEGNQSNFVMKVEVR